MIDLRSDTVTKPTEGMRKAIFEAEVGDDVFGEDPTVNHLQNYVADMLGKERAIYVCSGTMGNLLSVMALTEAGDEVIIDAESHIRYYEGAGTAAFCGVQLYPIDGVRGAISAEQIRTMIRPKDHHYPKSSLVVIENTHNRRGGAVIPIDEIKKIREVSREKNLKMHLDGARLLNAQIASKVPAKEYAKYFDTVTICFSKGLGAPMGSMIAADFDLIEKVHRYRKMTGGGQRQVGIAAAAALYALENHVERLAEDHENAKRLSKALSEMPGVLIDPRDVETNIVIFDVSRSNLGTMDIVAEMGKKGVLMLPFGETLIRCVTHLGINGKDIDDAITAFSEVLKG